MSLAVQYAALVGRYIRMERPATEQELAADPDAHTIGMECTVAGVVDGRDADGAPTVEVLADYGYSFTVRTGARWSFAVWPDEATRLQFRNVR